MKRPITLALGTTLVLGGLAFFGQSAEAAPVACTVKLSSYTAPGSFDSLPGVKSAMLAVGAAGGGTICVDGMYNIRNFIDLDWIPRTANIAFVGTSSSSTGFTATANSPVFFQGNQTLRPEANGNTSSPLRGQYRYSSVFSNMKLVKPAGTIGRIFDFRTGAQVNGQFTNLEIDTSASGSNGLQNEAFFFGRDHQFHGNLIQNVRAQVRPINGSSVLKSVAYHNFWNDNLIRTSTFYKFNNTQSPGIELRPDGNGNFTNFKMDTVTGQNMAGGWVHIRGMNGGYISNSPDWDLARGTGYRDSIRLINVKGFALQSLGNVEQSYGQAALMAGRYLIHYGAGVSNVTITGTNATPKVTPTMN